MAGALVLGVLLLSATAQAQCAEQFALWAADCDAGGEPPRIASCPAGHVVFAVGPGVLQVDIAAASERAFVTVGSLGASPVGEFPDWDAVPAADRAAFEALVECVRARPDALMEALEVSPGDIEAPDDPPRASEPEVPVPWRIVLGFLIALVLAIRRFGIRGLARRGAPLVALSAVTMLVRQLLLPASYFHQNGQGPFWIAHALGEPSIYGPGYAQVFSWVASGASDPDGAVFLLQAVLSALVPGAVYVVARGVGAHRALAVVAALAVAVSPLFARLAQGESYFATCGAFLAIAAAILAGVRPGNTLQDKAAVGVAAGLFVAQAALIHPVCWIAAALLPCVVLLGPGDFRPRLQLTALLTSLVAGVVLAAAASDMFAVIQGPLGTQWLDPDHARRPRSMSDEVIVAALVAAGAAVRAALRPRFRRGVIAASALGGVLVVGWLVNILGAAPPWVIHAYRWLYLAPVVACVMVILQEVYAHASQSEDARRGRRALAGCVAALAIGTLTWQALRFEEAMRVPTDAREAMLLRSWRTHLPPDAVVVHLERAENQIVGVPLYDDQTVRLRSDATPLDLTAAGRDVFVYRPSLCTTSRGRAFCDDIDETYVLQPVHRAVLPAIPSMEGFDYDRPEVEVGLYRVRDRRSGSTTPARSSDGREGR